MVKELKVGYLPVSLEPSLLDRYNSFCKKNDFNRSFVVRELIRDLMDNPEKYEIMGIRRKAVEE